MSRYHYADRRTYAKGITEQLTAILDETLENVEDNSDKLFKTVAAETVNVLHANSPKRRGSGGGDYAAGWTYEPVTGAVKGMANTRGYIVHNATDYQLTHLLENGHELWNATHRTRAIKHIRPAEQAGIAEILKHLDNITK